jgi:hypothetical protein
MRSPQKAIELIESAFQGMKFGGITQVPFADHAGCVSSGFETVRQRRFGYWQTHVLAR